jgi:2-polyprenyl-6-methoxyphenol hydroxylase-like FAD-dependent oxidoreductase
VLVAGGGIGGLATAIALRQAGIEVTVFERARDLRDLEVGLGIHMWQNAVRALRKLGVDGVESLGETMERMEWHNARGRFIAAWNVGDLGRKLGAPAVGLVRSRLQAALAARVEDGVVHAQSELVEFEDHGSGVVARFANGREERGDVLVGADGVRSLVRARLHGRRDPKYAGYMIWNATVELPEGLVPPHVFRETWGSGARFGFFPVGGRTYWFCIAKAPPGGSDPPGGRKAALLDRLSGWAEPTAAVIEPTPEEAINRADVVGRDPLEGWGRGRVTLLGDAAHPMTPNLGQGAAQAMEDALALASCLREHSDPAAALRAYEEPRARRTADIMKRAWTIGATGRWESTAACVARDWLMRLTVPTIAWTLQKRDMAHEL